MTSLHNLTQLTGDIGQRLVDDALRDMSEDVSARYTPIYREHGDDIILVMAAEEVLTVRRYAEIAEGKIAAELHRKADDVEAFILRSPVKGIIGAIVKLRCLIGSGDTHTDEVIEAAIDGLKNELTPKQKSILRYDNTLN